MALFRRKPKTPAGALRIRARGQYAVAIVGESHYQTALEAVAGSRRKPRRKVVDAAIIHDDDNPHSKTGDAIRIEIDGRCVGHLKRGDDTRYRRWLAAQGHPDRTAICRAEIRGGGKLEGNRQFKYLGVWLDIPEEAVK